MAYSRQHPAFGDQWNGHAIDSSLSLAIGHTTAMLFVDDERWIFSTFQYTQVWWIATLFWKWMPSSFPKGCTYLPHSAYVREGNRWQALEDYSSLRTKPYPCMDITDWNVFSAICQWRWETDWSAPTDLLCPFSTHRERVLALCLFSVPLLNEYSSHAIAPLLES